jgi:hypothetical protein
MRDAINAGSLLAREIKTKRENAAGMPLGRVQVFKSAVKT